MALLIKAKNDSATILAKSLDSKKVILLEGNWYYDAAQVNLTYLKKTDRIYRCPYKGLAYWYDLEAPNISARNIAWVYEEPMTGYEHIAGRIAFYSRETSATFSEKDESALT